MKGNPGHDLFLLMLNLSQVKSRERILDIFTEALSNAFEGLTLRLAPEENNPNNKYIGIATANKAFGQFEFVIQNNEFDFELLPLIRNAVRMLAIILEKREQEELLADERVLLESLVEERTREVVAANKTLQQEIQERLKVETQLISLTKVIESTSDFVSTASPNSVIRYLNNAGKKLTGWDIDENSIPDRIGDFHPRWALEIIEKEGIPVAIRDGVWRGESALLHKEGHEIPVSQVIMSHFSPGGELESLSTIIRDIRDRKKMEAYQAVTNSALFTLNKPVPIRDKIQEILSLLKNQTKFDAIGVRLSMGDDFPYYEMIGFPSDFIEKENLLCSVDQDGNTLRDPDGNPVLECMCGNVLQGRTDPSQPFFSAGGSFWTNSTTDLLGSLSHEDIKIPLRSHCNRVGYESVALVPLKATSRIVGLLQFNDMKRDRLSPELIDLFEGIATSIGIAIEREQAAEQQVELEQQLRQAKKMESVGRLAGGIAHDFNNLLSPIIVFTELLLRQLPISDPRREFTEQIMNAANRSAALTHQLLAFSRKQVLEIKPLDLNAVIENILPLLKHVVREDIQFKCQLSPEPLYFNGDLVQIEQVLMNLSINAQDAMPTGGELTLETKSVRRRNSLEVEREGRHYNSYVVLMVGDTGIGMNSDTTERIFDPFFTTKDTGKGTGLGLATVHGIAQQHEGFIEVKSEVNIGSLFSVYFPQIKPDKEEVSIIPDNADLGYGQENILLIEDDKTVRQSIQQILEYSGYNVIAMDSPIQAVNNISKSDIQIDLLLTDVIMPEMNGPDLYQELVSFRPDLKVLYMSGYADNQLIRDRILNKGLSFISKPFSIRNLTHKIRSVIESEVAHKYDETGDI